MERLSGPLLGDPNFGYWGSPTNSIAARIPVCFENPQDFVPLTLQNGWTNSHFSTRAPAVMNDGGVIRFAGAMETAGTSMIAFQLPAEFRPSGSVYVPVDLCDAVKGRLFIQSDGTVTVQGPLASAQCFTSLDGATFALSSAGYTPLTLENGWQTFATRVPMVTNDNGIVRFHGALTSGTTAQMFTLPVGYRPFTNVYMLADLCGGAQGRVYIFPDGRAFVQAQGAFSDAQCFTSLEGISFNLSAPSTVLTLNTAAWSPAPFGTNTPAASIRAGIVQLSGGVMGNGVSSDVFTLPVGMRPSVEIWVPLSLCNAKKGRLDIKPSGVATVKSAGAFSDATCFTSLEGVSFATSTGNDSVFRGWVRDAVERTWQRYARVAFVGWGMCAPGTPEPGIHVLLETVQDGRVVPIADSNNVGHVGKFALDGRRAQIGPDQGLWLNPNMAEARTRNVAVHEFGHALGFWHEESRVDGPPPQGQCGNGDGTINNGATFGYYDTASIMSYCGGQSNGAQRISANDIASVQKVYGRKVLGQVVTPRGNCVSTSGWTSGATDNRPYLDGCNELTVNQFWTWARQANGTTFAFTQAPDTDPTHTAAITMGSAVNGTVVKAVDLATASYQWTLENVEIRGFGAKCLTYPGTVGANLTMVDCSSRDASPTRNANQRWDRLDPNGRLRLNGTNTCVAIPNKNAALGGQKLITAACNSADTAQQFNFGPDGPQKSTIKYRANQSFCFDVLGVTDANFVAGLGGPTDGAQIQLKSCSAAAQLTQDWNITGQLHALGKCLDRPNGVDKVSTSSQLQTNSCTSAANGDFVSNWASQEWDIYWK